MLKTLGVHFIRHPCLTRTVRVRTPPAPKKAGLCLFVVVEVGRGCRIAVVWVAASCSDFVRPPSCILARPAQCEFAPPQHQKKQGYTCLGIALLFLVPMAGVEPARYCYQRILSPSRLPIPSHRLIKIHRKTALHNGNSDFTV